MENRPMLDMDVADAFTRAMREDDLRAIRELAAQHPQLLRDLLPPGGSSALFRAACEGRTSVVALLLDLGVDPNIPSHRLKRYGQTALFGAVQGHLDVTMLLLARGANPNASATNGVRPLHLTAKYPPEICRALLDAGAEMDAVIRDPLRDTPVATALDEALGDEGNADTAALLRSRGARSGRDVG
jgi:ankyrin repeat protein